MRRNLTDAEKYAYAAGVIDGEGSIFIGYDKRRSRESHAYTPAIVVYNTNIKVIEWFELNFGGRVYEYEATKNPKNKTAHVWKLHPCNEILSFIEKVYPYLLLKLDQARTMLFFLNRDYNDSGKQWYDKMRELNKTGKDVIEEI